MTKNADATIKVTKSVVPWSLFLIAALGVAKWGFGLAIPLWLVFISLWLPLAIGAAILASAGVIVGLLAFAAWATS